jgi:hypothetical protein
VYEACVSDKVYEVVEGFNASIFTYGGISTGKS